ncbi:uncharacterized protein PRCAT00005501001 [Priceomyces carsonii]|uniref:uncharacterized protein n=1 Tax=Priceomyces carsonii TaxID=28549 RepID=UPI002ED8668D|nr:unnamed protein product [Priceomyces carsonii]
MGFIEPGKPLKRRRTLKGNHNSSSLKPPGKKKITNRKYEEKRSILERMPEELSLRIFVSTGLEGNNLPLANKYLNNLLRFRHESESKQSWRNLSLVDGFSRSYFEFNLNEKVDFKDYEESLDMYIKRFPASNENVNVIKLISCLEIFKKFSKGLLSSFFKYKFISLDLIGHLKTKEFKVLDQKQILEEISERPRLIESLLAAISNDLNNLTHNAELISNNSENRSESNNLLTGRDNLMENSVTLDRDSGGTETPNPSQAVSSTFNYRTFEKASNFPECYYNNMLHSRKRFEIVKSLNGTFNLNFLKLNEVLVNVAKSFDENREILLFEVLSFLIDCNVSDENVDTHSVIEYLRIVHNYKESKDQNLKEDLNKSLLHLLSIYYKENHKKHDSELWLFVMEIKNYDLFQYLMRFNDHPSNDILRLMNL